MSDLREAVTSEKHEWLRPTDEKYDFRVCVKCGKRTAFYMYDKSECFGEEKAMSKLKEKIDKILIEGHTFLIPGYIPVLIREQILDAVITHLEKYPAPRATEEDACYFMKQEMIKSLKEG